MKKELKLEEVKANPKCGPALISNMKCNGWNRVVWTRWGNWPQPFYDGKVVILKHNVNGIKI